MIQEFFSQAWLTYGYGYMVCFAFTFMRCVGHVIRGGDGFTIGDLILSLISAAALGFFSWVGVIYHIGWFIGDVIRGEVLDKFMNFQLVKPKKRRHDE
jgi:hypothetical protein